MRINSARPIKQLTAEEREALRDALPPGTLPPMPPITAIQNQIPVEEYLMIDPEDLRDRIVQFGLQRDNQFRSVNDREAEVLKFTFGTIVGNFLINIIRIKYDATIPSGARTISNTQILLKPDYNPEHLRWLGNFIHEAAHIWQWNTGRHRDGVPGENYAYDLTQLHSLDLKIEEHAMAVQHWFNVNYGIEHSLIGPFANQLGLDYLQAVIRNVRGGGPQAKPSKNYLLRFTKIYYARLIEEIRNPCHIPALRAAHCR